MKVYKPFFQIIETMKLPMQEGKYTSIINMVSKILCNACSCIQNEIGLVLEFVPCSIFKGDDVCTQPPSSKDTVILLFFFKNNLSFVAVLL